jgi:hypothetical protein
MTWEEVVAIGRALPDVEPGSYHGYPALRVHGKFLVRLGDDRESIELKAIPFDEREMLLLSAPDVYHVPVGFRGNGIFARLAALDSSSVRAVLESRWRAVAPKRLVKLRDSGG